MVAVPVSQSGGFSILEARQSSVNEFVFGAMTRAAR